MPREYRQKLFDQLSKKGISLDKVEDDWKLDTFEDPLYVDALCDLVADKLLCVDPKNERYPQGKAAPLLSLVTKIHYCESKDFAELRRDLIDHLKKLQQDSVDDAILDVSPDIREKLLKALEEDHNLTSNVESIIGDAFQKLNTAIKNKDYERVLRPEIHEYITAASEEEKKKKKVCIVI